jgi:hypothetical protein
MAAIAAFLDDVATLTEGRPDFLGDPEVFPLAPHPVPPDRVAALFELLQLLGMAFPAFIREDHGFLLKGSLVVNVAGHAMDALLGMLRFHPGLKKAGGYSLMTFHAKSRIHLRSRCFGKKTGTGHSGEDQQQA